MCYSPVTSPHKNFNNEHLAHRWGLIKVHMGLFSLCVGFYALGLVQLNIYLLILSSPKGTYSLDVIKENCIMLGFMFYVISYFTVGSVALGSYTLYRAI